MLVMRLPSAWLALVAGKGGADDAADARALGLASLCWAWPGLDDAPDALAFGPCRRGEKANDARDALALCTASLCGRDGRAADAGDALALGKG